MSARDLIAQVTGLDAVRVELRDLGASVRNLVSTTTDLAARVYERRTPPEPPRVPAFVYVLCMGEREVTHYEPLQPLGGRRPRLRDRKPSTWERTTLGAAGHVNGGATIELPRPNWPLRNVDVFVFCDVEKVRVSGVFCGTDLMQAALGECPMARIPQWNLGVQVRVHVESR